MCSTRRYYPRLRLLTPSGRVLGNDALDASVDPVEKQFRKYVIRGQRPDVINRRIHGGMRVVLLAATTTSPPAVVLFDDAKEPCHPSTIWLGRRPR
jgi:hypothetical protein